MITALERKREKKKYFGHLIQENGRCYSFHCFYGSYSDAFIEHTHAFILRYGMPCFNVVLLYYFFLFFCCSYMCLQCTKDKTLKFGKIKTFYKYTDTQ